MKPLQVWLVKCLGGRDMKKRFFVAEEDEGIFNIFSYDDFDSKGRYIQNKDYALEDFDIVYQCETFQQACAWVEANEKW